MLVYKLKLYTYFLFCIYVWNFVKLTFQLVFASSLFHKWRNINSWIIRRTDSQDNDSDMRTDLIDWNKDYPDFYVVFLGSS